MIITQESPDQPDIIALVDKHDAYCSELYPFEFLLIGIAWLADPRVVFLVARDAHGIAIGYGVYVNRGSYAEVIRLYVDTSHRLQGIGSKLLAELTRRAAGASLKLKTGIREVEAIALYRREGFTELHSSGHYREFMLLERSL